MTKYSNFGNSCSSQSLNEKRRTGQFSYVLTRSEDDKYVFTNLYQSSIATNTETWPTLSVKLEYNRPIMKLLQIIQYVRLKIGFRQLILF